MEDEIVVIANPAYSPSQDVSPFPSTPAPGGSGNPANHPAVVANRENQAWVGAVLNKDADISDEEIVVTGTRFRAVASSLATIAVSVPAQSFQIPCTLVTLPIRPTLLSMRFTLTNRDFGPGRAGANYASGGYVTPVDINYTQFQQYMAHGDSGAAYLILHEVAHTFKVMRDYTQLKWNEFLAGAGANLTPVERDAMWSSTPQHKQIEARTNTIAREMYKILSQGKDFSFEPGNGYGC